MLDFSIYLLYRAGSALVTVIPLRVIFVIGELLGLAAWLFRGKYRRLARRNLAIAFRQEKSRREIGRLARRHFQLLGANLLSSVKLGTMPLEEVTACVSLENADLVHAELRAGRPVVMALSHLGAWELFAQVFPKYFGYVRLSTVYQPLGNLRIDEEIRAMRGRAGVELFDRRAGFQEAIKLLRSGGLIGVLTDQHAGDYGTWVPFFDRMAATSPLAGLLAKRTGAGLLSAAIYTAGRARWRMVFGPRFDSPGDSVPTLTAKANEVAEEQIRHAPEDWLWVHNRWKTPYPNFLLMRYKRGLHVPPGEAAEKLEPFRILIRGTNWLGDNVISVAAVRAIKNGRPDAHISVAVLQKIAPVWRLISEVDEVIELPPASLIGVVRLLRRQRSFDAAILFPNSLRSALEVFLAGVPRRVGYRGHHRSWLLNQIVPERAKPGPIKHQVLRYLHMARYLGVVADRPADAAINSIKHAKGTTKIGLCPGAEYGPAKRWLPERFAEVASTVAAQSPVQWILFGTAPDAEIGRLIAEKIGDNCVNLIGQTTLEDLIAELRQCRLLLTNDTGTMHLATLLGVPVVAVFGSTEQRLTGPLGPGHTVIRHHVECSPCFLRECPIDFRCMKAVTSDEVTAAVLARLPPHSL